jgi:ABC-type spermidine/putrescine transport system permease subunit II
VARSGVVKGFAILVALFLVVPVFIVIPLSLSDSAFLQFPPPGWTTRWYSEFFSDSEWTSALWRSLRVGVGSMLLALVLGMAASYALVRGKRRILTWAEPLMLLPMMVPIIVYGAAAYVVALSFDLVGSLWALLVFHAVLALPYVVINLTAALRTTDERLELVAQSLGASPLTAFRKVLLPIIWPAALGAGLIAFALSLDEAVLALFIAGDTSPTLPAKMYTSIRYDLNPLVPTAAALMIGISLLIFLLLGLIQSQAARRGGRGRRRRRSTPTPPSLHEATASS